MSKADTVKINVINWVVIGLMALTFIVIAKIAVTKVPIKGVTEVVTSA